MRIQLAAVLALTLVLGACAGQKTKLIGDRAGTSLAEINVRLGVAYLQRGQYKVALRKLQSALSQNPQLVTAHTTIAVVYEQIGAIKRAEKHYRRAVQIDPTNGMAQQNLATFLCKRGKYAEAEKHFLAAVKDPFYRTPELAYANAGICLARDGQYAQAEKYLRKALEIDDKFPTALFHLSRVSFEQGDFLSARAFLERYAAVAPVSAESLFLGVLIERKLGDQRAASEYARRLRAKFPESTQSRRLAELELDE